MYKAFTALAASLLLGAASAHAGFVFDGDGPGGQAPVANAHTFDWLPGNALSIGSTPAIDAGGGPGNAFQTVFQARLGSVVNSFSQVISLPGLNTEYEFTIVASFPEIVSSVVGNTTTFEVAPGAQFAAFDPLGRTGTIPNYVEIWVSPVNASDLNGTGFNDGILALSGTVVEGNSVFSVTSQTPVLFDSFEDDDYSGYQTLRGIGTTEITATIDFVNTDYFPGFSPGVGLDLQFFNTSQITPYNQQNPSMAFVVDAGGVAPVAIGANPGNRTTGFVNGVGEEGGTDFQFQADANSSLNIGVVPEPASVTVWAVAIGLVSVSQIHRRRRQLAAAK